MRSQEHNKGELKELKVSIEKNVVDSVEIMAKNGKISVADLVVIALKRYRASHGEFEGKTPRFE